MTHDANRPIDARSYTLISNAKRFRRDAHLEPIADAMDRGDHATWTTVHPLLQDRAAVYRDIRADHDEAVRLGIFTPDPDAA